MIKKFNNKQKKLKLRAKEILKEVITTGELRLLGQFDMDCVNFCISEKYINGVQTSRSANGRNITNITKPKITPKGLAYLYPKRDLRLIIVSVIACISILINIIQMILP